MIIAVVPALAAPMPGTSSSKLVAPELGLLRSPAGFQVQSSQTGWRLVEPLADSKYVHGLYKPNNGSGSLSVRVDQLEQELSLERYVQRWQKEYPRYGFDVISSQGFNLNKTKGFVLDLINRDNHKQLRQVVFVRSKTAAILTCRDEQDKFNYTLKACNQIIKTFRWSE